MNFQDFPSKLKAAAARDAWSLDTPEDAAAPDVQDLRTALRALLADETATYPLTLAPRAQSPDDLIDRLDERHAEMATLLGIFAFDRDEYPELHETIRPLAESLGRVVAGLKEKSRLVAANPQAADSPAKIVALEEAFDAIDANLAHAFAVGGRALAQSVRVKKGVWAVGRRGIGKRKVAEPGQGG